MMDNKCKLTGITNEETLTIWTIQLQLDFQYKIIKHCFHAVEEGFSINTDGIIGGDFLSKYMCKIDYETQELTIIIGDTDIITPLYFDKNTLEKIRIPPRTKVIHPIKLTLNVDSLILNEEIQPGIFLANSIVPANGKCHVKILNTTDKEIEINRIKPKYKPLTNYLYFKQDAKQNKVRFNKKF